MKILFTTITLFFFLTMTWSQSPEKMNYQSIVRNVNNSLVTNQSVGIKISILQGSINGSVIFEEIYNPNPTTNINGLLTLEIGNGIAINGMFNTINWGNGPYFIKSETDPNGGTNYTLTGVSQLMSVPYALHAKTANTALIANNVITYEVGDFAQGGVVFWLDETGQHGLVCAISNQSNGSIWKNTNGVVYNTSHGIYAGKMNTAYINIEIGFNGFGSVASQDCSNYMSITNNISYGDWYLPSLNELLIMYQNRLIIDTTATANGGEFFNNASYWTSNYYGGNNSARYIDFSNGTATLSALYDVTLKVRAIRSF